MKEAPKYVKEVQEILASIDGNGEKDTVEGGTTPPFDTNTPVENTHVYIEEFEEEQRITLIRKKPYGVPIQSDVSDLDTEPLAQKPKIQPISYKDAGILPFGVLLILTCIVSIVFQLYLIINPYTVTVALLARSQQVTLTGTLQLGRALNPITLSQSQTVQTTGKGHQDAKQATGTVTFYNGLFTEQFIAQGTMYTGSDGIGIVTTQDATIPPGNPTTGYGTVTVNAQAQEPGTSGNITAGDVNITINNGLLVRNNPFHGGQDERNFQSVAKSDIESAVAPLKSDLAASVQAALQGQLKQGEELQNLPCSPSVASDHQIGQEATKVKVTASETCSGIAYNGDTLQAKVTQLLTTQAIKKLGSGYSMLESPQISIIQAAVYHIPPTVSLSFKAQSAWVYAMSSTEQKHIKSMIAGKSKDTAVQVLASLPGIESVSIESQGFGDNAMMPKHIENIRLAIIFV